ncbi:MAG TPA: hypothetical protein VHT73_12010 [Thermodesulfobacteriota bacterium]|nr:hypothetical protein [Thermodesulfobacteriota bacterium]
MLKTNVLGSLVICLILLAIVGYFISLGFNLNWSLYFKAAGVVAVIAAIISILAIGGDRPPSHH